MDIQIKLYSAFEDIPLREKKTLIQFIAANYANTSQQSIKDAIAYALKHKPSFGGFITVAYAASQIVGTIIANKTGMEGYTSKYIFVYTAIDKKQSQAEGILKSLMDKSLLMAENDAALHIAPDHPFLAFLKKMGFVSNALELRFGKNQISIA